MIQSLWSLRIISTFSHLIITMMRLLQWWVKMFNKMMNISILFLRHAEQICFNRLWPGSKSFSRQKFIKMTTLRTCQCLQLIQTLWNLMLTWCYLKMRFFLLLSDLYIFVLHFKKSMLLTETLSQQISFLDNSYRNNKRQIRWVLTICWFATLRWQRVFNPTLTIVNNCVGKNSNALQFMLHH